MSRRKSRRDEWDKMRDTMTSNLTKKKGVDARELVPDTACGKCKHFSESAYGSDGRGFCMILKTGSDITLNPPVYHTVGEVSLITFFNVDASACRYYEEMAIIDTDGTECADPHYRRTQRQMEKFQK